MLGITDLWTYVLGTVAIILLPGPNSLYVLSIAARRGVRAGYKGAAGVFLGDAVLMVLSAAGVASLLRAYPPIFMVIKYAGAAYLGYVGLTMLRAAWRRWRTPGARRRGDRRTFAESAASPSPEGRDFQETATITAQRPFRRALAISLLNPKAILFFISFFIQFVDPSYAYPALSFLLLGLIAQLCSALYLSALIFTGTYLAAQFRRRRRLAAAVTTGIGALFFGFGVKLATASLG